MRPEPALVLTNGLLAATFAKTCHGLLRNSGRFEILGVVDAEHAGADAGEVLDGKRRDVPVFASIPEALEALDATPPTTLVIGVAFPGGYLPEAARGAVAEAIRHRLSVVSGLHHLLGEDPEFRALAAENGVQLTDIRRPRPTSELHFWHGKIRDVKAPRVAVLGTDCAVGKRTTCRWLQEAGLARGLKVEMIYTGQTGWLQGHRYGFIFDATPNDFVSGELERAIVECDRELSPDLILIEGQSALRNPSGPCGSELLLSAEPVGVVLQHAPGREFFLDLEEHGYRIPPVEQEIALIQAYGVPTLAVTLNEEGMDEAAIRGYRDRLREELEIPVLRPLTEPLDELLDSIQALPRA